MYKTVVNIIIDAERVVERKSLTAQTIARQAETCEGGADLKQGGTFLSCDATCD